jgi:hypothetical protein
LDKVDNLFRRNNHDLACERQPSRDRGPKSRFGYALAYDKGSDCADVYDVELGEFPGDRSGPASVSPTDVDGAKKYDRGHERR